MKRQPFNVAMDYVDASGGRVGSVVHRCDLNMHGLSCQLVITETILQNIPRGGHLEMYAIGSTDSRFFAD